MNALKARLLTLIGLMLCAGAQATTVEYYHTDALGSVVAVTDQQRNVIERREYEPYGYQLTPVVEDGPGYTGHVQDAATGLVYVQQRYYDPAIGRFLSYDPDPVATQTAWNFNRYSYAGNSPYTFVDPDGRRKTVAWLVRLTADGMRKVSRLTREQAIRARQAQQNIVGDRRQISSGVETAALGGRSRQMKHQAHKPERGDLPHYQTEGFLGHSFWGKLSVGAIAMAGALDNVAEAAETIDPMVSLTSGSGDLANHERSWYGAYRQVDASGPTYIEALQMRHDAMNAESGAGGSSPRARKVMCTGSRIARDSC